jgi:hypothetical protein
MVGCREDVSEAQESLVAAVDMKNYQETMIKNKKVSFDFKTMGLDNRLSLIHHTSLDFSGTGKEPAVIKSLPADQKIFVSDTKEITWNTEKTDAAYLSVNTPQTKFFTGFPEGRKIDLGGVTLEIGNTRLNWATVSLVSRYATGFGESGQSADILVAATGVSENSGRTLEPMGGIKITLPDRGGAPVLAEGITATITLTSDYQKTKCYALDPHGDRKIEVPVKMTKGGNSKIILKPEFETIWYEIDIQ